MTFQSNTHKIGSLCALPFDIICFQHEVRTSLRAEGDALVELDLAKIEDVEKMRVLYLICGFEDNMGLTKTNVLIRSHKNIVEFSKEWTKCVEVCIRDQISFDCLLHKHLVNYKRLSFEEKAQMFERHPHVIQPNDVLGDLSGPEAEPREFGMEDFEYSAKI